MKNKIFLLSTMFSLIILLSGCSSPKETKTEFDNFGELIENIAEWDFKEENFKDSDFERSEDEDYNVSYTSVITIGGKELSCDYEFEDKHLVRASIYGGANNAKEAESEIKFIIDELNKYCNMYLQEATNQFLQDYTENPIYAIRINNDVDPMDNINDMINDSVDGGEHAIIYRSKNGEFKDIKFSCYTTSNHEGATYTVTISNIEDDIYTQYYSEEE